MDREVRYEHQNPEVMWISCFFFPFSIDIHLVKFSIQFLRSIFFTYHPENERMSPKKGLFSIGNTSETNLHFLGFKR